MFSVLYVDDEHALLELGKLFLERTLEFRVEIALSAIDALASPAFPSYDVIVSDYQMPEMDGIAFLKIVRERFGDIPFILFTGRGREDVVIEAINNGADFYLQKGGDVKPQFAELMHKIKQALARRQAEHSLRESEKRLADIINFLPDATFAINRDGVIIAWNRAIDEMTGLSAEMMLGKGDHEYALPFYGERRPILIDLIFEPSEVIEQKYSNIIRQKDVLIADTNLPRLQGREVTLVGKASPLYNSQGEIVGAIEAIRDITEQKTAEDELQAAYEQITASEGELREQLVLQAESEKKIRQSEARLWYMIGFYEKAKGPEGDLLGYAVEGAGAVTSSPLGYLAFLNEDESELSMYAWSKSAMEECSVRDKPIVYKTAKTGLWGEAVRQRRAVITNDYAAPNPAKKGYPPGHPRIVRHMNIPVMDEGHIVLVAGVANKPADYTETDVQELQFLMQSLWLVIKRRRTEGALQESEEKYRDLFENSVLGIFRTTTEGKFSAINTTFARIAGYDSPQQMMETIKDVRTQLYVNPEDRDWFVNGLKTDGFVKDFEAQYYHRDGHTVWILINARAVRDVQGEVRYFEGTIEDITEHKKATESLLQEKIFSDAVLESIPGLLYLYDSEGRLVRWNKSHETLTGYTAEELAGMNVLDWFKGDDEAIRVISEGVGRALKEGQATAEANLLTKSGKRIPFFFTAKRLEIDKKTYFTGVGIDITDRQRAQDEIRAANEQLSASQEELQGQLNELIASEQRIRESEAKYRELAELLPQIVFEMDRNLSITFVNRQGYTALGFTPEDVLQGFNALSIVNPSQHASIRENIQKIINKESYEHPEYSLMRKDGSTFPALIYSDPVYKNGALSGFRGIIIDISDRKNTENALRESEATLLSIFRAAPVGIGLVSNRVLLKANDRLCEMTGYSAEELIGRSARILYPDDEEFERVGREKYEQIRKFGTGTVETRWQRKDGDIRDILLSSTPLDPENHATGVTFTALDITDRKRLETTLVDQQAKLTNFMQNLPVGVFRTTPGPSGRRIMANPIIARMHGFDSIEEFMQTPVADYYADAAMRKTISDRLLREGKLANVEIPLKKKNGVLFWARLSAIAVCGPNGEIEYFDGVLEDITERKRAEEALHMRDRAMATSINAIVISDLNGTITYVNDAFTRIWGYTAQESVGMQVTQLGSTEDEVPKFVTQIKNQGYAVGESVAKRKDGSPFTIQISASLVVNDSGKPEAMLSTFIDITERKEAEEELRSAYEKLTASEEELRGQYEELASAQEKLLKSQEQLEEIAVTVPGVVYQFYARPEGSMGVYYVSSRAGEVFGLDTPTQDFFAWFTEYVDPRDREAFLQSIIEVVKAGRPWNFEGRFIKPSGEKIWFQGISRPIARQGELVYSGVLLDITSRKLAEQALHESEEKYRTLVETTGTGFVIIDEQGLVRDANPEYIRLSGHSNLNEITGRSVTEWTAAYEKDKNTVAISQCIRDGYIRNLEIDYVQPSGIIIPIEINATVLPHGDTVRILTLCRDISKRRITQEALRESEEKYRTVIEQSHDGIFIAQNGLLIFHNPSFATLTGYSSAELAGRSIADLIAPEDRELVMTRHKERQLGKALPEVYEFSVLPHDGTSRIRVKMNITSAIIGGRPATIGTLHNVMEERKREEALSESEARLSSILHSSPTLQFVIDRNHKVISWNRAIEDYSGIKAEDIIGTDQQWRAFYPEKRPVLADLLVDDKTDDIPKWYGGKFSVSRLVEGAYEATDFFPTMGASGKWLNVTAVPIRSAQGTIIGAVETLEDITERRNAEQALREANHKLNLLNSITRHDVANQLTILQGFAQIAALKKGDPVITDYLTKIITAADTIAEHIEFTREYQEVGVRAPVWTLLEDVIARVENRVPVKFSGTCKAIEVFADPMLERVFFNIVDNAIRHGGKVTEITVRCEREPDGILVIVEDNGSGIPVAEKEKIFERGVGKNTGLGLFLVKEILSISGSTIKETGIYGKGARFEISVPEGKYRVVKP